MTCDCEPGECALKNFTVGSMRIAAAAAQACAKVGHIEQKNLDNETDIHHLNMSEGAIVATIINVVVEDALTLNQVLQCRQYPPKGEDDL